MKRRPSGFTLIELLISIAILAILATFAIDLTTRLIEAGRRIEQRANAVEAGNAALGRWREDVGFARRIEVAGSGDIMTIHLLREGNPSSVEYALQDGRLLRTTADESVALATGVAELQFTPNGRGWRAQWVVEDPDGIQVWRRPIGGLGAPLLRQQDGN